MHKERPLSPHLQVYRPQMTSMLSVLHRGTGIFLFAGTPLLVFWLWAVAGGEQQYATLQSLFSHWLAQLLLLGWIFSTFYHLCNGVRHLFWDVGRGYEMETLYASGKLVLAASILLTAAFAYLVLQAGGAS